MRRNEKDIADRIDAMSIEQARVKIASGTFGDIGSPNHKFAESWLSAKEKNLKTEASKMNKQSNKKPFSLTSSSIWYEIEQEYGFSKRSFGKKINFVEDQFKRKIIFRDIEHAYVLAKEGFSKPAVILSGGVTEELLRLYLDHNNIIPSRNNLDGYIKVCEENKLIEAAIHKLADSVRHFRNLVHLEKEISSRQTISKSIAKGAVSSIFTIANDFT